MKNFFEKFDKRKAITFIVANVLVIILWLVTFFVAESYLNFLKLENWFLLLVTFLFWAIVINLLTFNFWKKYFSKNKNKLLDKYNSENEYEGWLSYHDWNQKRLLSVFNLNNNQFQSNSSAIILETFFAKTDDIDLRKKKIKLLKEFKYSSYQTKKSKNNEDDFIYYRRSDDEHSVIVFGIPGTGKTSFLLIPSICANIISTDKPSMTIVDVKGELYENTATLAKENGYKIIKINCVDPFDSHRINPLDSIIEYWQNLIDLKKIKIASKQEFFVYEEYFEKNKSDYVFKSDKKTISENIGNYEFNNIEIFNSLNNNAEVYVIGKVVFNNLSSIKESLNRWISFYSEKSDRELDLASELVMSDFYKNSGNDKFWAESAKLLLKTTLNLLRFQYWCGLIKKESFNFYYACNMLKTTDVKAFQIYVNEIKNTDIYAEDEIESDPEWVKMINTSKKQYVPDSKTFESILMSAFTSIDDFSKFWIGQLTSKNEINLNKIFEEPTIIYLIFSESEKNRSKFCCYILDLIWRLVEDTARKYPRNKLPKNLYMYNDEFGNISFLKSAEPSVTLGRGYGVRSVFFIQDYAQIEKIYGKESANIIFNSCKTRIFLGTKNEETIKKFTENFGTIKKLRSSVSSAENKDSNSISSSYEEKTIVHKNTLLNLQAGKAVLWIENQKPFLTQLEKPWLSNFFNFQKNPKLKNINPEDTINDFLDNSENYLFSKLEKINEEGNKNIENDKLVQQNQIDLKSIIAQTILDKEKENNLKNIRRKKLKVFDRKKEQKNSFKNLYDFIKNNSNPINDENNENENNTSTIKINDLNSVSKGLINNQIIEIESPKENNNQEDQNIENEFNSDIFKNLKSIEIDSVKNKNFSNITKTLKNYENSNSDKINEINDWFKERGN